MIKKRYFALGLIVLTLFSACSVKNLNKTTAEEKKVRNIILFIGDGMGTAHVYAGMSRSEKPLALESFPFTGFSKTYSADNYVTDSGAGGTALACGVKTRNGMIGMGPDSVAVSSVLEIAYKNGLATGVLCTSALTDATPASFVAHNISRGNYEAIAKDFLRGTVDVFIGGGEDHFRKRSDNNDLALKLKEQGYAVVYNLDELKSSGSRRIAGFLAKDDMSKASEGRAGMLTEMTAKAIDILSRDKDGFFMMVEGSMIDWGSHERDFDFTVSEMIDLDNAVRVARDFAEKNGETLVVVTADHETGGLTLPGGSIKNHTVSGNFNQTGSHTGVMVPVFSYGPGAERFSGIHENTFFKNEFIDLLGIKR